MSGNSSNGSTEVKGGDVFGWI